MPKPLSVNEIKEAAETFFPLFDVVHKKMPKGSTVEDSLKVMESVAKLAFKHRQDNKEEGPFGFNKNDESETDKDQS